MFITHVLNVANSMNNPTMPAASFLALFQYGSTNSTKLQPKFAPIDIRERYDTTFEGAVKPQSCFHVQL